MNRHFSTAVVCLLACLSGVATAADDGHHSHDSHAHDNEAHEPKHHDDGHDDHHGLEQKAHLHGLAELTLVVEGDSVEIELESPAANLVGFEHRAQSNAQIAAVENARTLLESADKVFTFEGGSCQVLRANADLDALHHHTSHAAHDDHKGEHSEVTAIYRYHCPHAKRLEIVSVHLLALFPGIETLRVQWISEHHQGAVDLTKHAHQIVIK